MQINLNFDLSFILYNEIFLSIIGALFSMLVLYIYKCVMVCDKTNKWSFLKLFILNFSIIYIILYVYSGKNNYENNYNNMETTTPPEFDL
tara:strand:- start:88 stop:357 length:270 start_codon:yes stop_codon:yes gene_type:complete